MFDTNLWDVSHAGPTLEKPMTQNSASAAELEFLSNVLDFYASLISFAKDTESNEPGLGGQLLYAGALNDETRSLIVAANVAGAATLAVSADSVAQKQAIRDGVADFAVTTLDEALRILKNSLRKGETVSVCVGLSPDAIDAEMRDRGVAPDLIAAPHGSDSKISARFARPANTVEPLPIAENQALVTWSVAAAAPQWLPRLDALAAACLDPDAWIERRWLRLAPRFLGRMVRGLHALRCDPASAERFVERIRLADLNCELGVPVEISVKRKGLNERHRFSPAGPPRISNEMA
jgi:hypothetical protein